MPDIQVYDCPECDFECSSIVHLDIHMMADHNKSGNYALPRPLKQFEIAVVGRLCLRVSVSAKDLDSAYSEALKRADDHLRDDGELIGVDCAMVKRVPSERATDIQE